MANLKETQITDFKEQGAVPLYGVFADWVETLRRGIADNLAEPGPSGRNYTGEAGDGRFYSDYCNWDRIPEYRDFVMNSPAAEIASELMGARSVQLFHEHILVKEAMADVPTPWHQDKPYYSVACEKTVSFWIPLDEVPRERTLEFVAGSHRGGALYQPQYFNGNPLNDDDGLPALPDIGADRDKFDIVGWALKPGDAIAFDFGVIHGAPANRSAASNRRAFSLRLLGEGATFVRIPGRATSPPFPDVTLEHGAPLVGPEFPVLWRG